MRQGSKFIILTNNFNIVSLSMCKLAKMGCRIWADIKSPRVNGPQLFHRSRKKCGNSDKKKIKIDQTFQLSHIEAYYLEFV